MQTVVGGCVRPQRAGLPKKSKCLSLRKVFQVKSWPPPLFRHFLAGGRRRDEVVKRLLEFVAGGGGTRLISSSFSFVSFRCWEQNINMNFWWIIRSPILLAVVVISSVLCVCFVFSSLLLRCC